MVKMGITSFVYRSEEKKIPMRRLIIFTGLSTYIRVSRSGITFLETLVLATRLMFSEEF